ncbi:MAG: hypothetical protein ABIR94_23340 [Rubrivivax sp.]
MKVRTQNGHRATPDYESLDTPFEVGLRAAVDTALIVAMIAAPFLLVERRSDDARQHQAATPSSIEVAVRARGPDAAAPPPRTNDARHATTRRQP